MAFIFSSLENGLIKPWEVSCMREHMSHQHRRELWRELWRERIAALYDSGLSLANWY